MELLLTIGAACSAVTTICTLFLALSKRVRQLIKNWILKFTKEQFDKQLEPINETLNYLKEKAEKAEEEAKTRLGHSIMTIYDRSIARGYMSLADRKDLIELHQAYNDRHGNHHVDEYYKIMMDMDVK